MFNPFKVKWVRLQWGQKIAFWLRVKVVDWEFQYHWLHVVSSTFLIHMRRSKIRNFPLTWEPLITENLRVQMLHQLYRKGLLISALSMSSPKGKSHPSDLLPVQHLPLLSVQNCRLKSASNPNTLNQLFISHQLQKVWKLHSYINQHSIINSLDSQSFETRPKTHLLIKFKRTELHCFKTQPKPSPYCLICKGFKHGWYWYFYLFIMKEEIQCIKNLFSLPLYDMLFFNLHLRHPKSN